MSSCFEEISIPYFCLTLIFGGTIKKEQLMKSTINIFIFLQILWAISVNTPLKVDDSAKN
jgi:hypothetical protein